MAIYCNTLEGNMQYGDDPYCFTPNQYYSKLIVSRNMYTHSRFYALLLNLYNCQNHHMAV